MSAAEPVLPTATDSWGPAYAPVGPWFTLDAPSLRVPAPVGQYVSIWCAGQGLPVVLVPAPGASHVVWEPLLPLLSAEFSLNAIDLGPSADQPRYTAAAVDCAVRAVGASVVLADQDARSALASAQLTGVLALLTCALNDGAVTGIFSPPGAAGGLIRTTDLSAAVHEVLTRKG